MTERCADVEPLLSAYVDGALTHREWEQVGRHVVACSRCRTEADSLRVTAALLRGGPLRTPPQHILTALAATSAMTAGRLRGLHAGLRRLVGRAALALASVVALLVLVGFVMGGGAEPVRVPVDQLVADHLARTTSLPVSTPELFEVVP